MILAIKVECSPRGINSALLVAISKSMSHCPVLMMSRMLLSQRLNAYLLMQSFFVNSGFWPAM